MSIFTMSRWPDLAAHSNEVSPVESTAFTYAPIEKYWNQNRDRVKKFLKPFFLSVPWVGVCKKCCNTITIYTTTISFGLSCIFVIFQWAPFLVKEMHLLKSNFLSSQMDSHSCSPSFLPLHKVNEQG